MIILALGTNIEPREKYLTKALAELENRGVRVIKKSSIYQTPAWGGVAENDFLNMCIEVETTLDAYSLLTLINEVEKDLGRVRLQHWGDRTIDIDIIKYNDEKYNDERLIVPHKYLHDRNFVLLPIYEIAGDLVINNKSIKESLEKINDEISIYKKAL